LWQLARNQRHGVSRGDPKFGARIILRELRDDSGHKTGGARLGAADTDLATRRVDEILDLLDALDQLIENRNPAIKKRASKDGGLHPLRIAVEQPHPQRRLQRCNGFGNGRL
jgi:hypothetical protein